MKQHAFASLLFVAAALASGGVWQRSAAAAQDPALADEAVAHGEYIVRHVAMCIYCHTPKESDGSLVEQQLLRGAVIPVSAPYEGQEWEFRAPDIAGLPGGWTVDEMVHFLRTGRSASGRYARLPMPPFRMSERDARAVAAFVATLE